MPKRTTKTNWKIVNNITEQFGLQHIDSKQHFRFGRLECSELATVRTTRHTQYNINYHFVWIPKTRMRILTTPFKESIERTILRVCAWNDWNPPALQVMPDHVHFFISAPPKWAHSRIVQSLKAWTSRDLREF